MKRKRQGFHILVTDYGPTTMTFQISKKRVYFTKVRLTLSLMVVLFLV